VIPLVQRPPQRVVDQVEGPMIDSVRTDLGLDDLADREAGENHRQIFSQMVRAKSMNRIFHEFRAAFGRAWRLNLEGILVSCHSCVRTGSHDHGSGRERAETADTAS